MSTRPATLTTSGQAAVPSQVAPSAEPRMSRMASSEPRPAASAMPRRSASARVAMLPLAPDSGMSSQLTT